MAYVLHYIDYRYTLHWSFNKFDLFQYSWKLLHPTDTHQNPECPQDAEEYERVRTLVY